MLLLAAVARLMPARALEPEQGFQQSNATLAHLGLTVIALIYVLLCVWQG